jgi:PHO85 cyclin-6/7
MASQASSDPVSSFGQAPPSSRAAPPSQTQPQQQQPSPPNDDFQIPASSATLGAAASNANPGQTVIHVRDLAHIQSLARADLMGGTGPGGILNDPPLQQMKYEISGMPIGDIIEMVAALLTKITTTNDLQHDAMQRNVAHQQQASQTGESSGSSQMSPLSHSVLAFHGKNVPAITILSYLSRIHKYCPTTYEVFLSLLVYFDRMTERVNDLVTRSEEARRKAASQTAPSRPASQQQSQQQPPQHQDTPMGDESDSDLADDDDEDEDDDMGESAADPARPESGTVITAPPTDQPTVNGPATYFVVDSFNIHRLIISGVTCASKFFSDVFYTNSRYAKVGFMTHNP